MSTLEQMVSAQTQKSVFIIGLLICASVIIVLFPSSVYADHVTPNPCAIGELDIEPRNVNIVVGGEGSRAGKVPVYDEWVIKNLISLARAMKESAAFSKLQDQDIQRTRDYLRLLCEKEYNFDHTFQHDWRDLIGIFVQDTVKWVQTAYNGNPAFVNSQYVYYRAVTDNVFLTYLQEVARSDVGDIAKRSALIGLLSRNFANVFPYITTDGSVLAPDGVAESLSSAAGFVGNGGLAAQIELQSSGGNSLDFGKIAVAEFDRRLKEQKEYENEKLAWGRGFFSYEICDLDIFGLYDDAGNWLAADPNDRRNCRIATPGSLIQDQVSFVLGSALRQMELADEVDEWVSGNAGLVLRNVLGEYGLDPASFYIDTFTTNDFYKPETVGAVDPIIFSEIYASNEERAGEIIGGLRDFLETDTDDDGVANGTLYPREFSQRDIELDAVNASETGVFTATLFTTEEARRILESSDIENVGDIIDIIPDLGGP